MDKNNEQSKNNKHWLSLDQWRQDPGFQDLANREFMSSPLSEESQEGWARRDFLKLMGASLALTSFGCVRRPAQKIVPYVKRPEGLVPGVSNLYASTYHEAGQVTGLVVRTREGRPVKLEGNEFYPGVGEALSTKAQGSLLSLYDPDRLNGPKENLLNKERTNRDTVSATWSSIDKAMKKQLSKSGAYVLSGANPSSSSRDVISRFVEKFGGKYYQWSPFSYEGFKKSFKALGEEAKALPRFRISKAKYILSVGTDFLDTDYGSLQASREWGDRRDVSLGKPVELVQVESLMSLTGTNADKRIILRNSDYLSFLCAVISELKSQEAYAQKASSYVGIKYLSQSAKEAAKKVAASLVSHRGSSIVMGHGHQAQGADYAEILKAVHFLNFYLGNDGKTIDYSQSPYVSYTAMSSSMENLISDIKKGKVKTLFVHDTNPIYSYYDAESFKSALLEANVKVVYTGDRNDETGKVSHYLLPDHHALEKWNELEGFQGVYSVAQPTISPLYDTKDFEQNLLDWMGDSTTWYDLLKAKWQKRYLANKSESGFASFEEFWVALLQKGVWDLSKFKNSVKPARAFSASFNGSYRAAATATEDLIVYPSSYFSEGKLSNVGWLQECPDPVTKIVWGNYVSVSLDFAEAQSLKEGDVVEVMSSGLKLKLPVHIQPGQDSKTLGIKTGYGREAGAGKVCEKIGANAFPFAKAFLSGHSVSIKKTSEKVSLANTQGHHAMEGRQIAAEASYDEFKKKESAGIHRHKIISLWSKHKYTGHKWAMSIDLSKCTGCSACIVACQSENNIPVVGKKHVLNGREMHWVRVDRYYAGDPKSPRVLHQPVMCMHCDNAPCETVCPVLATVHSSEGTNDMAYNRCVGTRYCANNCPYKVRRFNWFNYSEVKAPLNMALNPEVTVRSRGVMEKCTFCIHKVNDGKSQAKLQDRKVQDGDIKTACEMTCPTKAIVFGDMNDPKSRVSKKFKEQRTYELLEELNVVPSVRYMTKIWNTENEIAGHGHHDTSHGESHKDEGHHKKEKGHHGEAHS